VRHACPHLVPRDRRRPRRAWSLFVAGLVAAAVAWNGLHAVAAAGPYAADLVRVNARIAAAGLGVAATGVVLAAFGAGLWAAAQRAAPAPRANVPDAPAAAQDA
jgi:hypothetical protein